MGRAAREAFEEATRVALEGFKIRQSMANEAQVMLNEKMAQVQDQEKKKVELEALKEEKQKFKEEAEAPEKEALDYYKRIEEEEKKRQEEEEAASVAAEATEYFSLLDTDNDGTITMAELQARPGLDTNKDGEVSEDEAKFFLGDKETFDMETFKDTGFALLKPYLELQQVAPAPTDDAEAVELTPPVEEYHAPDHPMMTPPPTDFDSAVPDHPMMTPSPDTYEIDDYTEENVDEDEDYDINDHGDDRVFAVLSGQCFSHTDNEYTYKMCPFDHCSQRGKHGGSETRLGGWGEWTGPEGDKYASMKFTGGQGCWN